MRALFTILVLAAVGCAQAQTQTSAPPQAPAAVAANANPSPTPEPSDTTQTVKIETLVEMLEKTPYKADAILKALNPKVAPPFKAVRASEKKLGTSSTMEVTFEMAEPKTKLSDLTTDSLKWKTGPLLPDTGRCPLGRDWSWPKEAKNVSCSAIADGCSDMKLVEITGDITCFINLESKSAAKKKTPGANKRPNSK